MVLADSHGAPRTPCYSGNTQQPPHNISTTGLSPTTVRHPNLFDYTPQTLRCTAVQHQTHPTTPITQPLPGITHDRFSLIRFRSPLLTESLLFSLPAGTEMFHFPAFPPRTLCIQVRVTRHNACWVSPFGDPRITARLAAPDRKSVV